MNNLPKATSENEPTVQILKPDDYPNLNFQKQEQLFARGNLGLISALPNSVCITGPRHIKNEKVGPEEKRKISEEGLRQAQVLGEIIADLDNFPILSGGFAYGIDDSVQKPIIAAHKPCIGWFANLRILKDVSNENQREDYAKLLEQTGLIISPYSQPGRDIIGSYYLRNELMVLNSKVLVAFDIPNDDDSGTFRTTKFALAVGKPVIIVSNIHTKNEALSKMSLLAFKNPKAKLRVAANAEDAIDIILNWKFPN